MNTDVSSLVCQSSFQGKKQLYEETSGLQQLNPTEAIPHDNSPTFKEVGKTFIQQCCDCYRFLIESEPPPPQEGTYK